MLPHIRLGRDTAYTWHRLKWQRVVAAVPLVVLRHVLGIIDHDEMRCDAYYRTCVLHGIVSCQVPVLSLLRAFWNEMKDIR